MDSDEEEEEGPRFHQIQKYRHGYPNPINFEALHSEVFHDFPHKLYEFLVGFWEIVEDGCPINMNSKPGSHHVLDNFKVIPSLTEPYRLSWQRAYHILFDFKTTVIRNKEGVWDDERVDLPQLISNPRPAIGFLFPKYPPPQENDFVIEFKSVKDQRCVVGEKEDTLEKKRIREKKLEKEDIHTDQRQFLLISSDTMLLELIARRYLIDISDPTGLFAQLSQEYCGFGPEHVELACEILQPYENEVPEHIIEELCYRKQSQFFKEYRATSELCDWIHVALSKGNPLWWEAEQKELKLRHPIEMGALGLNSFERHFIPPEMENIYRSITVSMTKEEFVQTHVLRSSSFSRTFLWEIRNLIYYANHDAILKIFSDRIEDHKLMLSKEGTKWGKGMTSWSGVNSKIRHRKFQLFAPIIVALQKSHQSELRNTEKVEELMNYTHRWFKTNIDYHRIFSAEMDCALLTEFMEDRRDAVDARNVAEITRQYPKGGYHKPLPAPLPNNNAKAMLDGLIGMHLYLSALEEAGNVKSIGKRELAEILTYLLRSASIFESDMGWNYLEVAVDILMNVDDPSGFAVCFPGHSGSGIEAAMRAYLVEYLEKHPELAPFLYRLFIRAELVEDARMLLNDLPDQSTTPEMDPLWLEWAQNQIEEEKRENYGAVILRMLAFLDYGSNKGRIAAWQSLHDALREGLPDLSAEEMKEVVKAWAERADWWTDFHQTRSGEDPELTDLKEKVIAILSHFEE